MTALLGILLESSIRIAAAALVAGAALRVASVRASAVKHAVWTGVLCAMLLMPVLPYLVPSLGLPNPAARVAMLPAEGYDFAPAQAATAAPPAPVAPSPALPPRRRRTPRSGPPRCWPSGAPASSFCSPGSRPAGAPCGAS